MPDEYISREAMLEHLDRCKQSEDATTLTAAVITALQCFVQSQPTADVAEVHHARWEEADWREYGAQSGETIRFPKAEIVCSDCRNAFKKDALWKRNFCPNCGAKMDGAAE